MYIHIVDESSALCIYICIIDMVFVSTFNIPDFNGMTFISILKYPLELMVYKPYKYISWAILSLGNSPFGDGIITCIVL